MGSISVNEHDDGDLFQHFEVLGISADHGTTVTGIMEDMVLLSWLIVLLRTSEGNQASYDWAYKGRDGFEQGPMARHLSTGEVMTGLQSTVRQVAAAISSHITATAPSQRGNILRPVTLVLSTGFLSKASAEAKDENLLHLEIRLENDCLGVRPAWYTRTMPQYSMEHHIETLVDTLRMCISNPELSIQECLRPTARDLDDIWGWNHTLPPSYSFCMHDVISEQARKYPNKEAISSWDGDLTYAQVELYSTSVAWSLKEMVVELHDVLPVCFEKSRWTIVAVLAAMKAGATFVLMDPTLPLARLQNMAKQVGAKVMLTSREQHDLSTSIIPNGKHIVVDADKFNCSSNLQSLPELAPVPSSALMYIIFTSGSTGTPKGVKISHETYTSSAIPRAEAVGYADDSRVLDFASYAFDVSIDSMLLTLGNGGCLCIPSDEDRMNDINAVIRRMQVNYAGLTPSVARILDPDVIASLSGLGLGGEAVSATDVNLWGQDARIIIGYGPCECTIGCTINSSAATGRNYISIGKGNGATIWIVDPSDHESLMPVGAVGELLVEGPIVGQGYLNDPDKTATSFIKNPLWLIGGHRNYPGRQGRLYKTGDLGRYDPDGSGGIVFAGRKDAQVKLRGQRVELGEIESQLRTGLPSEASVIAEVIVPLGSGGQPTLVAFLAAQSTKGREHDDLMLAELPGELTDMLSEADAGLSKVLPRYMLPTAYIPVNYIPVLISGKIDRKRLREFGATVDLRQLDQATSGHAPRQLSGLEQRLRYAWSHTLKIDEATIQPTDNFFALGGDSLMAMKLVIVCKEQGLDLTVANIFGQPTLSAMAGVVEVCKSQARMETPAFSMLAQTVDSARLVASHICESNPDDIEDIYPCTPTQESLFTFSIKSTKTYVAQRIACIPAHVSLEAWKTAWERVVKASPILRTRLAQLQDPGLQQVVLNESISWTHWTDLAQYLETDRNEKMNLGQGLARYAIVKQPGDGQRYMVWTVHHVLYDGWSEPLILKEVKNALQDREIENPSPIRNFVKYVREVDGTAMREFWRRELKGAVGPQFPRLPSRDYLPTPDAMVEHYVPLEGSAASPFTAATLIRGAWALVASQYTGSDDVVFGETLTGRDIPLSGVESIVGPLIATLPVRIQIDRAGTAKSYMQAVQQTMLARTSYQHMGMQNIRKVSQDAQHACEAGTGLVIQPEPEPVCGELGFDQGDVVREALNFNPYPLMLACGIQKGGFRVCASFDSSLIDVAQMKRVLVQLEVACAQLTKGLSRRIDEFSCLPEAELDQIWQWNEVPPLSLDESSSRFRADSSIKQGSAYPRAVIPWVCNPRNMSLLSPIGCVGELWLEGNCIGETVDSPRWLVAGSPTYAGREGRVQRTGDMVRLRGDGGMIFVGRRENMVLVQGHAVDIAEVDTHFAKYLPPTSRAAAAVCQPSSDGAQLHWRGLIVFIEQQPSREDSFELMPEGHQIICDTPNQQSFNTTICATVSISLAAALRKLNKFMQDSLPSYMVPSAYVVVDKMPTVMKQIDHGLLNQLALRIPQQVLNRLCEGFKEVWAKGSMQRHLSNSEMILQSSWARILAISPEQIDVDDNFFRLGGDSVLAMKLVSSLRAQGHGLTVADIFQNMRLGDAAKMLRVDNVSKGTAQPYRPFSTLGQLDLDMFFSEIKPTLADPRWSIRDVSPVTDSQAFDIKQTVHTPRTSIQYTMLYFDKEINRERLIRACHALARTHDILRTVFVEHQSTFFQVVLDDLATPITMHRTDMDLEQYVNNLCAANIELPFHLGSSFLSMFHVEGSSGQECLVIGLSHAQYDGVSLPRLLRDLETLYSGAEVTEFEPFLSYMSRIHDGRTQAKALRYWRNILDGSSLSILEGTSVQPTDKAVFKTRPAGIYQPVEEITTANLLTASWALVLARRLKRPDVTFGSVTSGRNIDLVNVENVVGPCYQITPVRVLFEPNWTAMDLLRFVQNQCAESAAHDFVGFDKIRKECTQWSEAQSFDSMVHHQDFEDFDSMPFAGGACRVEILKPHGDAAHPLKVVSFVQGGQTHIGVVGSERDAEFVDAVLDELVATVQELAIHHSERLSVAGEEM